MTECRLFATTRQVTGDPLRHYAYVMDRMTGRPVCTCTHEHRSRLHRGGKNGAFYAQQCADKMLRRMVGSDGEGVNPRETTK
jgi:hypothetical protein